MKKILNHRGLGVAFGRNQNPEELKSWPCGFFNITSCETDNCNVKYLKTRIKNKKMIDCITEKRKLNGTERRLHRRFH